MKTAAGGLDKAFYLNAILLNCAIEGSAMSTQTKTGRINANCRA
jgi:hypothetical protein